MHAERREERDAPGTPPAEGGDEQVDAPGADKQDDQKNDDLSRKSGKKRMERSQERDAGDYDV